MKSVILFISTYLIFTILNFSILAVKEPSWKTISLAREQTYSKHIQQINASGYSHKSTLSVPIKDHILPVKMLRKIPGPRFLLYFMCLAIICISVVWLLANIGNTNSYSLPELTQLYPFSIAALRGGSIAVIHAAVLSLWNKNLVNIKYKQGLDFRII